MSNNEKIIEIVEIVRKEATGVSKNFDRRNDELQKRTRSAIDVYSGTALSQVASIVTETRNMSEELYVSMQSYVTLLDSRCKALLDDDIPLSTIKKVWDLIVWLNEQSDIHISFTSQLNYNPRNDVADVNLFPTVENKFIQKEWENRYKLSPKYEEEQKRIEIEAKKEEERQEQAKKEAKLAEENRDKKFKQEKAQYAESNKNYEKLKSLADKKIAEFEETLKNRLFELECDQTKECFEELEKCREERRAVRKELRSAGFFEFKKKKQLTEKFHVCESEIARLSNEYSAISESNKGAIEKLKIQADEELEKYKMVLSDYIKSSFHKKTITITSDNPNKAPDFPPETEEEQYVLDMLTNGRFDKYYGKPWWNVTELIEIFDVEEYGINKVGRCIKNLQSKGYVNRTSINGLAHFAIAGTPYEETFEVWVEKKDAKPFPQPPKAEDILKI
jgi:hypothetical protein